MRTTRSLTVSRSICHTCPLPATHAPPAMHAPATHAPLPSWHAHPLPCMPPCHACPPPQTAPCHACPLPCMSPLPCMPPHHACPPAMHAPELAHIPPPRMPLPCHACTPPPVDRILDTHFWKYYIALTSLREVIKQYKTLSKKSIFLISQP